MREEKPWVVSRSTKLTPGVMLSNFMHDTSFLCIARGVVMQFIGNDDMRE